MAARKPPTSCTVPRRRSPSLPRTPAFGGRSVLRTAGRLGPGRNPGLRRGPSALRQQPSRQAELAFAGDEERGGKERDQDGPQIDPARRARLWRMGNHADAGNCRIEGERKLATQARPRGQSAPKSGFSDSLPGAGRVTRRNCRSRGIRITVAQSAREGDTFAARIEQRLFKGRAATFCATVAALPLHQEIARYACGGRAEDRRATGFTASSGDQPALRSRYQNVADDTPAALATGHASRPSESRGRSTGRAAS